MPDLESFDAFYARTVGNITSQMHALAGEDSAADHALREAYARAYQQWFQIAGYPDPEGWVLAVAKDAYQRRRPMAAAPLRDQARPGHDPLSMPGMFRPAVRPEQAGTGDTTLPPPAAGNGEPAGSWFTPPSQSAGADEGAGAEGNGPARGISGVFGGPPAGPASATATAQLAGDQPALTGQSAERGQAWWPPGPTGSYPALRRPLRRPSVPLIALIVVIAMAVAGGVTYLLTARNTGAQGAGHGATAGHHKPAVHMLPAGQTGSLSAIPWSIVGAGWALAEVSTAAPNVDGSATAGGTITTYLVDPEGGKYQIQTSAAVPSVLLAWSGNAQNALVEVLPAAGTAVTYELLSLTTGTVSALSLPAGVSPIGFTRPDGLNILAVDQTATAFQLERFNLQGTYQATIGSLPVKPGVTPNWQYCGTGCGALSSPDGLTAVWGVGGDEMQYLSNLGGPVIRRLTVPDSGSPGSCVPLTWWNEGTVLASCAVTGRPVASRLWLVPADGSSPTALTGPSGTPAGMGDLVGAWHLPGAAYVAATNFDQCPGAASGPGGMSINTVSGGALQPITVSGTTNNHNSVVSAFHGQLLLLAQTGCPGTYSLLWLNPSTGATQTVLSGPTGQVGVVAAVPYGNGPTAIRGG